MSEWPRIIIDPAARQIERPAVEGRFWIGVRNAAMGTVGAALLLLVVWCVLS